MTRPVLSIAITTWNSETFARFSIPAAFETTLQLDREILVWDNESTDRTAELARGHGATVIVRAATQSEALAGLWRRARGDYVLLMHADVLLLGTDWFDVCRRRMDRSGCALLAPEDIGCGPFTRPFGIGKPESSFLLFRREKANLARNLRWRRLWRLRIPERTLDFWGPHITHRLPQRLAAAGLDWCPMQVQTSDALSSPRYGPYPEASVWSDELAHLRYGLGNFYSVDGRITHYHNWYERAPKVAGDNETSVGRDFPARYIRDYTAQFLADCTTGEVTIPAVKPQSRRPVAL